MGVGQYSLLTEITELAPRDKPAWQIFDLPLLSYEHHRQLAQWYLNHGYM